MRTLLWVGDACVSTGFARATHYTLDVLRETWDVAVLGVNYHGDPHAYPYPVFPCTPGGDYLGIGRIPEMIDKFRPSVVIVQNDPWNIPQYLRAAGNIPMAATIAVDGKNCRGRGLNGLALALFWTQFGEQEARRGGYSGASAVVPLGVDLAIYQQRDKAEARRRIGLPAQLMDAFIVGNVNRNQPRKRLDLSVMYFAEWIKTHDISDAYLFLHVAPTGETGYDVKQLAEYCGVANRLILAEPDIGVGADESTLVDTYNAFDAQLSTTQGEGFGLTTFEGMACGVPQIVPDWSALSELCTGHAVMVPCTTVACTPNTINCIGGVVDRVETIKALHDVYTQPELRDRLRTAGLACVRNPRYRWRDVGERFAEALDQALSPVALHNQRSASWHS